MSESVVNETSETSKCLQMLRENSFTWKWIEVVTSDILRRLTRYLDHVGSGKPSLTPLPRAMAGLRQRATHGPRLMRWLLLLGLPMAFLAPRPRTQRPRVGQPAGRLARYASLSGSLELSGNETDQFDPPNGIFIASFANILAGLMPDSCETQGRWKQGDVKDARVVKIWDTR